MAGISAFYNFPQLRGAAVSPVQVSGEALSYDVLKNDLAAGKVAPL